MVVSSFILSERKRERKTRKRKKESQREGGQEGTKWKEVHRKFS